MVIDTREVLRWFGLDTRETLRWYGSDPSGEVEMVWFDPSGGVEMVWFWSLGRRLVWSRKLGRCKRLRDLISEKIAWFGFLGRRWYDLGSSGDAVSWWPPSGEVIIPWAGYPTQSMCGCASKSSDQMHVKYVRLLEGQELWTGQILCKLLFWWSVDERVSGQCNGLSAISQTLMWLTSPAPDQCPGQNCPRTFFLPVSVSNMSTDHCPTDVPFKCHKICWKSINTDL